MFKISFIFKLLLFTLLLISCSSPKTTIIKGGHLVKDDGSIEEINAVPGETLPEVSLQNEGDEAVLEFGSRIFFNVDIDTSKYTISTYFNNEDQTVTFKVLSKGKTQKVYLNNLCDIYIIPEKDIKLDIVDNYNKSAENQKYKLILVPLLNKYREPYGYLLRYDLEGVSKRKCTSYKRILDIEREFKKYRAPLKTNNKRISDNNKSNKTKTNIVPCPCKLPEHCNCAKYIYFGVCCKKNETY